MPTSNCRDHVPAAILAVLLCLAAGVTGARTEPAATDPEVQIDGLMRLMSGNFDNFAQFSAQATADKPMFSLLGIQRRLVTVPALGAHVVFAQVNNDADPTRIYRQRLYSFAADEYGELVMKTWSFVDEVGARDIMGRLADLAAMPIEAFRPSLPEGCDMRWSQDAEGWTGRVDPQTCRITSRRRGTPIKLRATEIVTRSGLRSEESGFTPEGEMVFGLPDGVYYEFLPTAP
jgi:hypothetical protein